MNPYQQQQTQATPSYSPPRSTPIPVPSSQPRKKQSDMGELQIGRMGAPAQMVRQGFQSDSQKNTFSTQVVLMDPDTIQTIRCLEQELEQKNGMGGATLNSVIVRTVTGGDGVEYPIIRAKMSKNPMSYAGAVVGTTMSYGDLFVAKARAVPWNRAGSCGVTLYMNQVHCIGASDAPIGAYERPLVVWD